jgi:hypothetical protein
LVSVGLALTFLARSALAQDPGIPQVSFRVKDGSLLTVWNSDNTKFVAYCGHSCTLELPAASYDLHVYDQQHHLIGLREVFIGIGFPQSFSDYDNPDADRAGAIGLGGLIAGGVMIPVGFVNANQNSLRVFRVERETAVHATPSVATHGLSLSLQF